MNLNRIKQLFMFITPQHFLHIYTDYYTESLMYVQTNALYYMIFVLNTKIVSEKVVE